jgi:TonB family protein
MLTLGRNIFFSIILHALVALSVFITVRSIVEEKKNSMVVSFAEEAMQSEKSVDRAIPASGKDQHRKNMRKAEISGKEKAEDSSPLFDADINKANITSISSMKMVEDTEDTEKQPLNKEDKVSTGGDTAISKPISIQIPRNEGTAEISTRLSGPGVSKAGDNKLAESSQEDYRQIIRDSIQNNLIFPFLAIRNRMQGTVIAEFSINTKGQPYNIRIIKSSGFSILDSAAKKTVIKASPFPVVKKIVEIPISFRLKNNE